MERLLILNVIKQLSESRYKLSNLLANICVLDEDSEIGGEIETELFNVIQDLKEKFI